MACFLVSATAAIGVGIAKYAVKHHEKKFALETREPSEYKFGSEVKWSKKLSCLEMTLWGGSFLLAIEHILHGEVVPYPPFLTAAGEGADAVNEMLMEMGTVGLTMLGILVAAWAVGVVIVDALKYRKHKKQIEAEAK